MKDGVDSDQAEQQLTRLLTLRHGKKDFFTWNMDSVLKTAEKTTYTLQLFLTLVAVISLGCRRHWRYEYYAGFRHRANA
ncbi:ABC transporter [Salmonella enterica subsp. enterica]|nr:ABC transporter [Salmonella enterica subsp. enterica]